MLLNWILVSFAAVLTTSATPEATPELAWQANYSEAVEQSRHDERPLLVVFDDPTDKTRRIKPELLKNGNALSNYELCHIDASTEYGKQMAEGFRVESFPHVAIIDRSGNVVLNRMSGPITEGNWKSTLERFKKGNRNAGLLSHRVSKPVTDARSASEAYSYPTNQVYSYPSQSKSTARPYCPSCQLRN